MLLRAKQRITILIIRMPISMKCYWKLSSVRKNNMKKRMNKEIITQKNKLWKINNSYQSQAIHLLPLLLLLSRSSKSTKCNSCSSNSSSSNSNQILNQNNYFHNIKIKLSRRNTKNPPCRLHLEKEGIFLQLLVVTSLITYITNQLYLSNSMTLRFYQ